MVSKALEDWKKNAKYQQENWIKLLGDRSWDRFIIPDEKPELFLKVAISLYGIRKKENVDKNDENKWLAKLMSEDEELSVTEKIDYLARLFKLKKAEKDHVLRIVNKCITNSVSQKFVDFAVIFIYVYTSPKKQGVVPLYRVRSVNKESASNIALCVFIDHVRRVYKNWEEFLKDNIWHMSWVCVPKMGFYSIVNQIDFVNQESRGDVLDMINKVSLTTSKY